MPTPEDKYAATTWGEVLTDLTVPSGQLCQVRRPGVEGLIRIGILDKVQGLSALVGEKHLKRVKGGKQQVDVAALMKDPRQIAEALTVIDRILAYVVVQPQLTFAYRQTPDGEYVSLLDGERDPEKIYTDAVQIDDKMFIFNYAVGGSRDIERFRKQAAELVAGLPDGGDLSLSTE